LTVSPTISKPWRIGHAERIRVDRVRENRDRALLWNSGPNTLTLSLNQSHW
jgi:hypothetical protein